MFWNIVKHPLTGIVVGIAVAVGLYYAAKSKAEPIYATQTPRLLAEAGTDSGDLRLLWKEEEIDSLYSTEVMLWNSGNTYIDKSMLSKTDRLRICPTNNANILQAEFTKTSRAGLEFNLVKNDEGCLLIEIIGDEALEADDGGLINILYTGNNNSNFTMHGRVKGYKDGFKRSDWANVVPRKQSKWLYVFEGFYIFQFLLVVLMFITIATLWVKGKLSDKSNMLKISILIGLGMMCVISAVSVYNSFYPLVAGAAWVS